ncbi:MAG: twin-arginine translocation signal domain-containing protein, partial [Planctomycetota bacterium]
MEPNTEQSSRRDFLSKACIASCGATCALTAVPVVTYLLPGEAGAATGPVQIKSSDLPEGAARIVRVGTKKVLVIRNGGKLTAVDAKCTHLGCIVAWD